MCGVHFRSANGRLILLLVALLVILGCGTQGERGLEGPPGAQGLQGQQGDQGPPGPQGEQGPAGSQGEQGPPGPQAQQGPAGPQGEQGPTDAQAAQQGPAGSQGEQGPPGPQGQQGPEGPQGERGLRAPPGIDGTLVFIHPSSQSVLQMTANPTANPFEIQTSTGTPVFSVGTAGEVTTSKSLTVGDTVNITSDSVAGSGALSIASGGGAALTLDSASGTLSLAAGDALTLSGPLAQSGTGQVTFTGNVNASSGLDVGGGALTASSSVTLGDAAADAVTINGTVAPFSGSSHLAFEGATDDTQETTFAITDPTADRTITFPDASGDVSLLGQKIESTEIADGTIVDGDISSGAAIANSKLAAPNSFFTIALWTPNAFGGVSAQDPLQTFQMPFAATLVEVSVTARDIDTSDGDETYTIDVEENGTSVLSSPIAITADNTPVVGTISDTAIADNAKIEVVLTLGGTSPNITTTTILFTFKVAHTN